MDRASRRDMLTDMLAKEPGDLFLNYAMAVEYTATDELESAEAQFKKVLAIDAAHVPAYYQLGKVCEVQERNAEALDWYRKGAELAKQQGNTKALGELNEAIWMLED